MDELTELADPCGARVMKWLCVESQRRDALASDDQPIGSIT